MSKHAKGKRVVIAPTIKGQAGKRSRQHRQGLDSLQDGDLLKNVPAPSPILVNVKAGSGMHFRPLKGHATSPFMLESKSRKKSKVPRGLAVLKNNNTNDGNSLTSLEVMDTLEPVYPEVDKNNNHILESQVEKNVASAAPLTVDTLVTVGSAQPLKTSSVKKTMTKRVRGLLVEQDKVPVVKKIAQVLSNKQRDDLASINLLSTYLQRSYSESTRDKVTIWAVCNTKEATVRNATITSLSLPSLDSAGPSTAAMTLEGKMPYNDFTVPLGSDSAGQRRVVSRSTSSSSSEDLEKLRSDRFEWCSEYSQQMYVHLETLQATYQPSRAYIDTTDLYAPHIMRRGGDAVMETPVLKGRGVSMSEDNNELESIRVNSAIRSLLIEFMIRMHDQNMIHHQDVLPMAISLLDRYLAKEYRRVSTSNTKPAPPYAQFPMPAEYGLPSVPWMPATKHLMQAAMAAFMLAIKYESRRVGFFLTPMCVVWHSAVVSVTSTKNSASKGKQRQDAASSTSKSGTTSRTLKCTGSQGIKMSNLGALAMIDDITLTSLDDYSSDGKAKHSDHDRDPFPGEHKKLVQMQHGMLRILDYALRVPTYTAFLKRYASFANLSSAQQTLCTLLLERVNLEYISLDYFPSLLAASAVYLIKCLGLYTMSSVHESSRKARSTIGGLTLKSKDMKQFQRNGTNAHLTNSTVESQERDIGKDGDLPYPGGQAAYHTLTAKDIWTSNLSRDTGYSVQMVDECAREMVRVLKDEEAARWKQHRDAQSRQQVGIHVTGSGSHHVNKAGKGRKVTPEKGFDGSVCRMYIPGDSLIHKYSNLKYSKLLRLPPVLSLSSDQESSDDSSDVSQKLQDLMTSTLASLMVRDVHYVRRRRARSDTPEILPDHLVDKTKGGRVIETWK